VKTIPVTDAPPGVTTVSSTGPTVPAGDVRVHDVVVTQTVVSAGVLPNENVAEPTTKPAPVTVVTVPPPMGPETTVADARVGTMS
jgi:hypothetical protein